MLSPKREPILYPCSGSLLQIDDIKDHFARLPLSRASLGLQITSLFLPDPISLPNPPKPIFSNPLHPQPTRLSLCMLKAMHPATCNNIRIRSTADCLVIFHAVLLGILPLVSKRLTVEERRAIHSGCVYVWEERSTSIEAVGDGLERWTDSRRWGASRLTKDFLLYQEKLPEVQDPHVRAAMHYNRLVKQTYSVFVDKPDGRRKWHLVAYSSPETGHHMCTIDDVPELARLRFQVPEGKYLPARCSKTRTRPDDETQRSQLHPQPPPGGSLLEFQAHPTTLVSTGGCGAGSNNSSPELGAPAAPYRRVILPASMAPLRASIISPTPICPSPPAPPTTVFDRPPAGHAPLLSVRTCLPKIDVPPPPTRPDPEWVLQNCVAVSPVTGRTPARRLWDDAPERKGMAPLVYTRQCPYRQRHPLDNDALRALDAMQ